MAGSKKFQLNGADLKSIGWGAFDVAAGSILTYLADVVLPGLDIGAATPVVMIVATTLIKAARKWLVDNAIPEEDKKK
jgi:hypothetical protein